MDIFPIALTNRDMNTLMRLIEQYDYEAMNAVGGEDTDPELLKAEVAQMSSRQMSTFLKNFEDGILRHLEDSKYHFLGSKEDYLEFLREGRGDSAVVYSLRQRVRRSR